MAKYYKAVKGIDRVAEGYSLIQSLGDEANPESSSSKKEVSCRQRRKYTSNEVSRLKEIFAREIFVGETPTLGDCKKALIYFTGRTAKNVQDKVRTIRNTL